MAVYRLPGPGTLTLVQGETGITFLDTRPNRNVRFGWHPIDVRGPYERVEPKTRNQKTSQNATSRTRRRQGRKVSRKRRTS